MISRRTLASLLAAIPFLAVKPAAADVPITQMRDLLLPGLRGNVGEARSAGINVEMDLRVDLETDCLIVIGFNLDRPHYHYLEAFIITRDEIRSGAYKMEFRPRCRRLAERLRIPKGLS